MADHDTDSPFWRDPDLALHDDAIERCTDVAGGLDALRKKPEIYLPRLPRETPQNYAVRKTLAELVNLYGAAVRGACGLLIAHPPTRHKDAPASLDPILQDVDGRQTGLAVWTRGVLQHMLNGGYCVAMASTPVRAGARPNRKQERELALRPYVSIYLPKDVLEATLVRVGAQLVLGHLRLREVVKEKVGRYGNRKVEQVLEVVRRKDERGNPVKFGEVTYIETDEIPAVEFSVAPEAGFGKAAPPLTELADFTISHYRVLNDRRWSLKQSCFPWPVRTGYQEESNADGTVTASVNEIIDLPMGGTFGFAAPPGTAFEPTRADLEDIERRAATMSLSFLAGETSGPQRTATAASIDQQGQDASLASIAVCLRDSLNRLGAVLDEMLGNDPRDVYFDVQTSFRGLRRDPALLRVLLDAWERGGLTLESLLYALKHGELPEELNLDKEALALVGQAEAVRQAEADRARELAGQPIDPEAREGDKLPEAA
jgi:hypothetical protein